MEPRVFREEDVDEVNEWFGSREELGISSNVLSRTGLIVPGVACGFLFATDSRICFLDFFISNPKADYLDRQLAMDEIAKRHIETAKERKYRVIFAGSDNKGIKDRCERFGFTHRGTQDVYTMELKA